MLLQRYTGTTQRASVIINGKKHYSNLKNRTTARRRRVVGILLF